MPANRLDTPAPAHALAIDTHAGPWPCLHAARLRCQPRRDWGVDTAQGWCAVGAVPEAAVALLCERWPDDFQVATPDGSTAEGARMAANRLTLRTPPAQRETLLTAVGLALREAGWVRAWRDEAYPLWTAQGELLAVIERATSRFWGGLTLGAHANGYVPDATGRPAQLWVARRAWDKPTDPGMWDNLVGGGVPLGQSPHQALRREAWEEAGLPPEELAHLERGSVLALDCDIPEGLQREWLYVYDVALPEGRIPVNQDGEVAEHRLLPVAEALALAASGAMTVDASLATLDFAARHGLLAQAPGDAAGLAMALDALRVPPALAARLDPA